MTLRQMVGLLGLMVGYGLLVGWALLRQPTPRSGPAMPPTREYLHLSAGLDSLHAHLGEIAALLKSLAIERPR
jgi:hypothetical protein